MKFFYNIITLNILSRRKYTDKAEGTPFLNSAVTGSPPVPNQSGTSTVNRTLLHHQQNHSVNGVNTSKRKATPGTMRGLAISNNNESPPPDYNVVVHDTRRHDYFILYFHSKDFLKLFICKVNSVQVGSFRTKIIIPTSPNFLVSITYPE